MAEHRADVVGALVAGPALEHAKLARVVEADVDRAVATFGEPGEGARATGGDCPVTRVDRPHDVAREEGLPRARSPGRRSPTPRR